jgi:transcriptional regulator with XRE-family HTH domain
MFQTELSDDPRSRPVADVEDLVDEIRNYVENRSASAQHEKLFRVLVTVGDFNGEYSSLRPELILDLNCPMSQGTAPTPDAPAHLTELDRWVGMRARTARELAGLTRQELAGRLGVTARQIQRYESGQARIGAGRLYEIAIELRRPTRFFFAGFGDREKDPNRFDRAILRIIDAAGQIDSEEVLERLAGIAEKVAAESAVHPHDCRR